jgi:hypothetical protein
MITRKSQELNFLFQRLPVIFQQNYAVIFGGGFPSYRSSDEWSVLLDCFSDGVFLRELLIL